MIAYNGQMAEWRWWDREQEQAVSPRWRQAQIELLTPILTCNIQKPFSTGVADSFVGAAAQGRTQEISQHSETHN